MIILIVFISSSVVATLLRLVFVIRHLNKYL